MSDTLGSITAELARDKGPLQQSHLDAIRRQLTQMQSLLTRVAEGTSDDQNIVIGVDGHQVVRQVWVSPTTLERFSLSALTVSVQQAMANATESVGSAFASALATDFDLRMPTPTRWQEQAASAQQSSARIVAALREHAPTHARRVEQALQAIREFQHGTFTGTSPGGQIAATINARGELLELKVNDVARREVDNHTFAGWLKDALMQAGTTRDARQAEAVDTFSAGEPS